MKTIASLTIILLAATCTAVISAPLQQKTETRSFVVTKGGHFSLDTGFGSIVINIWDKNEISVMVEKVYKEDMNYLSMTQSGNDVRVWFTPSERKTDGKIQFTISLPQEFHLDLRTGGGNVKVDGRETIAGKVRVQSGGGGIDIGSVNGDLELHTGGGNIAAGAVTGDASISAEGGNIRCGFISGTANIHTGGGNIAVAGAGRELTVSAGGGSIAIEEVRANAVIRTGGGNIALEKASGKMTISAGGGNISVGSASGEVSASTGGGNLAFKNVTGSIQGRTRGGNIYAEINPDPKGKTVLTTNTGNIDVGLTGSAKATVSARVQSRMLPSSAESDITCEFGSAEKEEGKNEKTFLINGGGSNILLETSIGKIRIRKLRIGD